MQSFENATGMLAFAEIVFSVTPAGKSERYYFVIVGRHPFVAGVHE